MSSVRTRSRASCSSGRSNASSTGSAAAKARAKAEAAKARLAFVEKEADLKLQQAKLEVSMEMLKHQKEAAAAIAEAEVLEAVVDENMEKQSFKLSLNSTPLETTQRTEQYIIDQTKERGIKEQECNDPSKTGPIPSCSILASHLKPDAVPFLPCQKNVSLQTPDMPPEQSGIYENEYARQSWKVCYENDHVTPVQHFRPQNISYNPISLPSPTSPHLNDNSSNINYFVRDLAHR